MSFLTFTVSVVVQNMEKKTGNLDLVCSKSWRWNIRNTLTSTICFPFIALRYFFFKYSSSFMNISHVTAFMWIAGGCYFSSLQASAKIKGRLPAGFRTGHSALSSRIVPRPLQPSYFIWSVSNILFRLFLTKSRLFWLSGLNGIHPLRHILDDTSLWIVMDYLTFCSY